jgi:AcrR family transcriptional regulator
MRMQFTFTLSHANVLITLEQAQKCTAKNMSTFDTSSHVLRPQQRRSRAALAKIVEAAEQLLRTSSIDDFSMAAVAQAAGLPVGNIYRRFRGKDELIQAIKEDVIVRIEDAVTERLSRERFRDISSLVHGCVGAVSEAFSSDESVHRFLFSRSIGDPALSQIGWSGRRRIFAYYRNALLPFLAQEPAERAELLVRVSFHLLAAAMIGKACADDQTLTDLSWNVLGAEITTAAIAYLQASVDSKPGC